MFRKLRYLIFTYEFHGVNSSFFNVNSTENKNPGRW